MVVNLQGHTSALADNILHVTFKGKNIIIYYMSSSQI